MVAERVLLFPFENLANLQCVCVCLCVFSSSSKAARAQNKLVEIELSRWSRVYTHHRHVVEGVPGTFECLCIKI